MWTKILMFLRDPRKFLIVALISFAATFVYVQIRGANSYAEAGPMAIALSIPLFAFLAFGLFLIIRAIVLWIKGPNR